jgi:DNA-binding Lrp family transcriptional regulator
MRRNRTPILDDTDVKILRALQQNADRSNTELARDVGCSPQCYYRKRRRLARGGYIKKIVACLDRKKLGFGQFFVQLTVDQQHLRSVVDAISACPEVTECHIVLGGFDIMLRVVAQDFRAFHAFHTKKLTSIPGVLGTHTYAAVTASRGDGSPTSNHRQIEQE